jgi:hypothetical protein
MGLKKRDATPSLSDIQSSVIARLAFRPLSR